MEPITLSEQDQQDLIAYTTLLARAAAMYTTNRRLRQVISVLRECQFDKYSGFTILGEESYREGLIVSCDTE